MNDDGSSDIIITKAINIQGLLKIKTNQVKHLLEEN